MNFDPYSFIYRRRFWAGFLVLTLAAGCSPRPSADELKASLRAAGVGHDIVWQQRGGPIDVPTKHMATLSLADAIRLSLQSDPQVQAALSRVRAAEADDDQQRLFPNPIVNIVARFPESSGKPIIDADLGVELIDLLQMPGRVDAADHRLRSASAEVLSTVLDTIEEVEDRYATVQSLDAEMPVLAGQQALLSRLLDLAQDRLNKGEGTQLDVTTLQTQELELEVDIAEKHLEWRQERLTLARLIGAPSGPAGWTLTPWSAPGNVAPEPAWVDAALLRRPEIASQRWELAALGVETRLARFSPFDQVEVGAAAERDSEWSVGPTIAFPLPLLDWGQAKRAKAAALESEAAHNLTKIQRSVVTEVRTAHAAYVESMIAMALARDRLVPAQERRRSDTEAAYLAGQIDITAIILAEEDLEASKIKLIELQEKASSAIVKLERAVGGPGIAAALTSTAPGSAPATNPSQTQPTTQSGKEVQP